LHVRTMVLPNVRLYICSCDRHRSA
jgi:hypothetical protein